MPPTTSQAEPSPTVSARTDAIMAMMDIRREIELESDLSDISDIETVPSTRETPKVASQVPVVVSKKKKRGKSGKGRIAQSVDVKPKSGKSKIRQRDQAKPKTGKIKESRRTTYTPGHLKPDIPAHHYRSNYRRRCAVASYLRRVFLDVDPIEVDFDLAVVFFLQETAHLALGDIPRAVDAVLKDFTLLESLTGRQDHLYVCAQEIQESLDTYNAKPGSDEPFAVRFPTLESLHELAVEGLKNPTVVGRDKGVVLVDLAGRVLAIGVPPRPSTTPTKTKDHSTQTGAMTASLSGEAQDSVSLKAGVPPKRSATANGQSITTLESTAKTPSLSGEARASLALQAAAAIHRFPVFHGPMTKETFNAVHSPPPNIATSPFPILPAASTRLTQADSVVVEVPGSINGVFGHQAWGYGLGSTESKDIGDTQMGFGDSRQGHPTSNKTTWRSQEISDFNLPHTIQMGEEFAFKRENNSTVTEETLWQNEISRQLIKAFTPTTYKIGMHCMKVIVDHAPSLVSKMAASLVNPLVSGRHKSYGTQVDYHRDGHNARMFGSTFFFGENYEGGELILAHLGHALCALPGYSVHGCYDILVHGVGQIRSSPDADGKPPVRISMALYPQANVYAGAARYSASLSEGERKFSDSSLWIPFYPRGFNIEEACRLLKKEERRLDAKYKVEKRRFDEAGENPSHVNLA